MHSRRVHLPSVRQKSELSGCRRVNSSRFAFLAAIGGSLAVGLFLLALYTGAGAVIFVIVLASTAITNSRFALGEIKTSSYYHQRRGMVYSTLVISYIGVLATISGIISNEFIPLVLGLLLAGSATLFMARLQFSSNRRHVVQSR